MVTPLGRSKPPFTAGPPAQHQGMNMDTNDPADCYFDRSEFLAATASPEYRTSARHREEVAGKLQRSIASGRITPMGEQISHSDRTHTRTAFNEMDLANGFTMSGAEPTWAEAGRVGSGFFKDPEEIANAFAAPAFEIDPTYQQALREKIARSVREGWLTADLRAAVPARYGN